MSDPAAASGAAGGPGAASGGTAKTPDVFPATLREVMLRPQWLLMLLLALVVAAVFAWLGQWQLGNAIDSDPPPPGMTEEVRPLAEVAEPGVYLPEPYVGQRVDVSGTFVAGDFLIVTSRYNDRVEGYWVTGQLRVDDHELTNPTSLAVAVGWAETREEADAAASTLNESAEDGTVVDLSGRIISDEGPAMPSKNAPQEMSRMSPAALLSQWSDVEGVDVYRAYLTTSEPLAGLTEISSPAPEEGSNVNWLNIFYAVEWAIFAGFAFYLWYRLARDAWEHELEDLEDAAAEREAATA